MVTPKALTKDFNSLNYSLDNVPQGLIPKGLVHTPLAPQVPGKVDFKYF